MQQIWPIIKMGLRAAVWKATPNPPVVGLAAVIGLAIAALAVEALAQGAEAGGIEYRSPYGLNSLAATLALILVVTAFFFRPEIRATAVSATLVFLIVSGLATVAYELIGVVVAGATAQSPISGSWTKADSRAVFYTVLVVWWAGSMLAIFRSVDPRKYFGHLARLGGLVAAFIAVGIVLPHYPVFLAPDFDWRTANVWEIVRAARSGDNAVASKRRTLENASEEAKVDRSQPALLEDAASQLSPQRPGVADVYAVGVAGWADQQVFRKELDGAFDAVARAFGTQGRTLKLVNDPETVSISPIATRQNFAAAVRSVARVMDKQEDILLLFLTSHGSKGGIAFSFAGLAYGSLTPADVAAVLADEGILNRIVIVSACYSGVFVKPLADYNTIVLTASDENSTSFGCSNERDWTYFGDALFNQSLLPGRNLETAFAAAKGLIAEWEARDGISASNPQAHFGLMLKEKLAAVYHFAHSAEGQNLSP